jgi:hypothetical protein
LGIEGCKKDDSAMEMQREHREEERICKKGKKITENGFNKKTVIARVTNCVCKHSGPLKSS